MMGDLGGLFGFDGARQLGYKGAKVEVMEKTAKSRNRYLSYLGAYEYIPDYRFLSRP